MNLRKHLLLNSFQMVSQLCEKNSDRSHLLMSGNKAIANIDNNGINSEDTHELLRITLESELTFENHINKI